MNKFDKQHQLNVRKYQRRIDAIYKKAAEQAARRAASLPVPDDYIFTFDDFPAVKKQIDALMATMAADMELTVTDGIRAEWDLSNAKNDALVDSVLGEAASLARYHRTHTDALNAFLERKQNGLGLSDNVWRYTNQFKNEIEMGLDLGIREGKDAASIARSIQQYLQYPDMLFRRVKDEHGVFQLSQRAAAFHPGQGVYRSSYKNALRLAATETNIAYRTADHERWQDLDFIVGIEVHLSNNHTILNHKKERVALFDICDELQGRYPKEFKFVGWHPNCRCIATTITKTKEEVKADLERIRNGEQPSEPMTSENYVKDMPEGFTKWMEDNAERLESAKALPYFVQDNFKDGDPSQGLRWMSGATQPTERPLTALEIAEQRHAARALEQIQAIQDAWDIRKIGNNLDKMPEQQSRLAEIALKQGRIGVARQAATDAAEFMEKTLIDYAPAMAKRNKTIYAMLDELDSKQGIDRVVQIDKLKRECANITISNLERCKATDGLVFEYIDTTWKMNGYNLTTSAGEKVVMADSRVDMIWYTDRNGKRYAYPIGATKDTIEFKASKASEIISSMPQYLQDNVKGVVFVGRENILDAYYRKEYPSFNMGAMYSGDPVTVHTKYRTAKDFKEALTHEIGHHVDLKIAFRRDAALQAQWAKIVEADAAINNAFNKYPTWYAKTNPVEDFAESMMEYVNNKRYFKKNYPNRAKFLERAIRSLGYKP